MTELGEISKYGAMQKVSQADNAKNYDFEKQFNEQSSASYYLSSENTTKSECLLDEDVNSVSSKNSFTLPSVMNENYFGFKESA